MIAGLLALVLTAALVGSFISVGMHIFGLLRQRRDLRRRADALGALSFATYAVYGVAYHAVFMVVVGGVVAAFSVLDLIVLAVERRKLTSKESCNTLKE